MVLCEGMYGYDNATLWGINDAQSFEFFSCKNNRRVGDTANDLLAINDSTFIIIVSTSNEIMKINREGTILAYYQVRGSGHFLKQACILNDSHIAITDLYADKVYTINHYSMTLDSLPIKGLCAPDGIAYGNGIIAICNSGYGIFRKNEQNASTITFYNLENGSVVYRPTGINPQHLIYNPSSKHWLIQYAHLTTQPDSLGGLQLYDKAFNHIGGIRGMYIGKPTLFNDVYHALNGKMIVKLTPNFDDMDTVLINQTTDQWYRIGSVGNQMYICNARNYTLPGSVSFYDQNYRMIGSKHLVGINPSTVLSIR